MKATGAKDLQVMTQHLQYVAKNISQMKKTHLLQVMKKNIF